MLKHAGIKPAARVIAWEKRCARRDAANALAEIRESMRHPQSWPIATTHSHGTIIEAAEAVAAKLHPRVQVWIGYACREGEFGACKKHEFIGYEKAGREYYPRYENQVMYVSYVRINPSGSLAIWTGNNPAGKIVKRKLRAPSGYRFGKDANGIFLRSKSGRAEYHPTAEEYLKASTAAIRARVIAANETAKKQKRESRAAQSAIRAELNKIAKTDVLVTADDSISAGNCSVGTEAFRLRHKISSAGITLKALSKIKPASLQEARRVRAACLAALRRTKHMRPDHELAQVA